ncbi:MAG: hypothetical protein J7L57_06605 [Deltaproteobacteria bacterium]|nr:hypothetical protein [Candidatus Tharpella sp.]
MLHRLKWQITIFFCLILLCGVSVKAQDVVDGWPREIETPKALIVIYQPQPESLDGNLLKGRVAVSLEFKNGEEPMFGAVWFEAKLDSDLEERRANLEELKITDVRIPLEDEEHLACFRQVVEEEVPKWDMPIALDRLLASLETVATQSQMAEKIKHDPPQIIFMPEPAILVTIDGEPRLVRENESSLMRVVNTPFTILLVPEKETYYLNADQKTWYMAGDIKGEWRIADQVPTVVAALAPKPDQVEEAENSGFYDKLELGPPPKVVVATEPTELISSTGKPEYTPIKDTGLLYLSNSDSDVFMVIESQKIYILLAGRWFSSKSLNGPWQYVPGDKLPADFAAIPEDSEMATVLYAVPGTEAAHEAAHEAQIPHTAKVDRKNATLKVEYDGKPRFETISGTRMIYATNTETPVIYLKRKYYACDEAIWFVAESPNGPWRVTDSVPEEIYMIPPDNPLYNVTFVQIYSSTPEEVYIGYTPGYAHTYVYNTTVVYGTGYRYPYWYNHFYYPRPVTYGYPARYNPWNGWSFGFSYCASPYSFYFGNGWYLGGWWGPYRYRGYRYGYRRGYYHGEKSRYKPRGRVSHHRPRPDLYNSRKNRRRVVPSAATPARVQVRPTSRRANNVFADKQGNIHRKAGNKWEKRTRYGWQKETLPRRPTSQNTRPVNRSVKRRPIRKTKPKPKVLRSQKHVPPIRSETQPSVRSETRSSVRPETRSSIPASKPDSLERSFQSRQRGTRKTGNFRRSRHSPGRRR